MPWNCKCLSKNYLVFLSLFICNAVLKDWWNYRYAHFERLESHGSKWPHYMVVFFYPELCIFYPSILVHILPSTILVIRFHFLWILGMFFCYDFVYHLHFDCLLFGTRLYLSISHVKIVCSRVFGFWKDEMNSLHIKLERTLTRMCGCLFLDHKIVGKHLETWQRCEQNLKLMLKMK